MYFLGNMFPLITHSVWYKSFDQKQTNMPTFAGGISQESTLLGSRVWYVVSSKILKYLYPAPLITGELPTDRDELLGEAGRPTMYYSCHSKLTLKMLAKFTHALSPKSTNGVRQTEGSGLRVAAGKGGCQTKLSKRLKDSLRQLDGVRRMADGVWRMGGDWWEAATLTLIVHYYLSPSHPQLSRPHTTSYRHPSLIPFSPCRSSCWPHSPLNWFLYSWLTRLPQKKPSSTGTWPEQWHVHTIHR